MKTSIEPLKKFLDDYGVRPDLTKRALEFVRPVIDRLGEGKWPLAPIAEIDPQEALRAFNGCFGMEIGGVEFVSRAALLATSPAFEALLADLIPVDGLLCEEALGEDIDLRMTDEMEKRFSEAMMRSVDPDGTLEGPPAELLQDIPTEFVEGLTLGILMPFSSVAVAAIGDAKLFERMTPAVRMIQRCLFLGFKDASRQTLIVLAA